MKTSIAVLLLFALIDPLQPAFSQHLSAPWSSDNLLERMEREKLNGIFLFNPQTDLDSFFSFYQQANIDIVFSNESLYRNKAFMQKARSQQVAIGLNFTVFFQPDYLKNHPEHYAIDSRGERAVQEWLHFACPSKPDFMKCQEEQLRKLIELTDPAMVSLDFIRFFVFWEKVYPETDFSEIVDGCYCDRCIKNFQNHSGITIKENTAEWIKVNALPEWTKWKCMVIEERVKTLSAIIKEYNIPVALKLVPWRPKDFDGAIRSIAGQDIDLLKKYVDIFIPMTYSHMLKREPNWINEMTEYIHSATDLPVLSCVEISKTYVEEDISDHEFAKMVKYGNMPPSNGMLLFHYDYIQNRKHMIMDLLGQNRK